MSAAQADPEPQSYLAALARLGGSSGLYRLPVYAACTLLALLSNYLLGKDVLWDTLDYHLYAGLVAVHDRFAQDYFGAGPGSYFNPYAYAPFYLLVSAGAPALVIASLLAVAHSTILWVTYELALLACPSTERRVCITVGICAIAFAFLNPVLIEQLGSSYADITTAALALFGWLLLARAVRTPGLWLPVCAGLALGAATGLKLTNAIHAVAASALILMLPWPRVALRSGVCYVLSLALGFAALVLPWSYQLEQHFGNPFFPLLNTVFRSPEFTTEPLRHFRFIPASLPEALWRPFALADPVPMVQVEQSSPDLRYAVLLLLGAFLAARWLWRIGAARPDAATREVQPRPRAPVLAGLALGLAVDWTLWLMASGNGRYFLPAASVAAVVLAALLFRAFPRRPSLRRYLLIATLAAQSVAVCIGSEYRSTGVSWRGPWFNVDVPVSLASQPNLYLILGTQSYSFIAPSLPRSSGLINLTSVYPLSPHGASGAHIQALIRRYAPHLRVLLRGAHLYDATEHRAPQRSTVDDTLGRFGLKVDPADCATISLRGLPPDLDSILRVGSKPAESPPDAIALLSCHVLTDDSDHSAELAREHAVDLLFEHLEQACPRLFQPRGMLSEHTFGAGWRRRYINTDLQARVTGGEVSFVDTLRGDQPVDLGSETDWARAPLPLVCGRRDGHYFARLSTSHERS